MDRSSPSGDHTDRGLSSEPDHFAKAGRDSEPRPHKIGAMTLDQRRLRAARDIFEHLAEQLDTRFSLRLWDGSIVPLGRDADHSYCITISGPGVLGSILRRPTLP